MKHPRRIFVLEEISDQAPLDCDAVFSFCHHPADIYPEDVITHAEVQHVFDRLWDSLMKRFIQRVKTPQCFYRDVDLMWCFKKLIFHFSNYSVQKYRTLSLLMEKYPHSEMVIVKKRRDMNHPFLYQILASSPLGQSSRIKWLETAEGSSDPVALKASYKEVFLKSLLPNRKGGTETAKVVIFSDYKKSKNVMNVLNPSEIVYFAQDYSVRTYLDAILKKFSYYGLPRFKKGGRYDDLANAYSQNYVAEKPLAGLVYDNLNLEHLVGPKVAQLFSSDLPTLLFQIDHQYSFFKQSPQLEAALLDEDISPEKNAFCQIAKRYGVQTTVECHGALGHRLGFLPLTADFIFVWGEAQKAKMIEWGGEERQILVSGCSKYSAHVRLDEKRLRDKLVSAFNFDSRKKIILIGFMLMKSRRFIFENLWQGIMLKALDILKEFNDYQFIIKVQRGDENKRRFEKWIKMHKLDRQFKLVESYDPLHLLKGTDLSIIYDSTLAIDGLALNKPVVCLFDGTATDKYREFKKYGAFYEVNAFETLRDVIEQAYQRSIPRERTDAALAACLNVGRGAAPDKIAAYLISKI